MAGMFGPQEICTVVGKDMLGDRKTARKHLHAYGRAKGSRSVYWCIFCGSYHMHSGKRRKPMRGK